MIRIAVVGPGAIGGTLAAWLAESDAHEVIVCAKRPIASLEVDVPGGRRLSAKVRCFTHVPSDAPPHDWVVLATKAHDTEGARPWLEGLLGPHTAVAVAQNGVEHRARLAGIVPEARVLPVVVELSAERRDGGLVVQRRPGRLVVPQGDLGSRFAALFASTPIAVEPALDFTTEAWRKLVLNAAGVVGALTAQPARVVHHPKVAELARGIALETIRVGRCEGARLDDAFVDEVLIRMRATAPEAVSSIVADRLAGRRTEVDARNGVVVRLGARHGVPTPLNAMAVAILEAWADAPMRA